MKILFLDFDGVLNSARWMRAHQHDETNFLRVLDRDAVARLVEIVRRTDCKIVVSSTWRILNSVCNLRNILIEAGMPSPSPVIDKTPRCAGPDGRWFRGHEIQAWLDGEGKRLGVESFCIIDDDSDMVHLLPKLIKTSWESGLLDSHVEDAVAMLGEKVKK